jgi:hypothetical protein
MRSGSTFKRCLDTALGAAQRQEADRTRGAVEGGLDFTLELDQARGEGGFSLLERAGDRVRSIGAPIGRPDRVVPRAIGRSEIERHGSQHRRGLLPARYVLWLYRQQLLAGLDPHALAAIGRCAAEADDRACHQRAMDAMAIALVARAVLGDARAVAELFVQIEGRAGRRRPDASFDPPRMDLEPIVRLMNERR